MASEPNGEHRHTAATDVRRAVLALNGLAGSQCARKDRLPESLNFSRSLKEQLPHKSGYQLDRRWDIVPPALILKTKRMQ